MYNNSCIFLSIPNIYEDQAIKRILIKVSENLFEEVEEEEGEGEEQQQ